MKFRDPDEPPRKPPMPNGEDRAITAPAAALRAIRDWVLLERDRPPAQAGALHLVSTEVPDMGTVLSVGPGRWCKHADVFVPTTLKPGDRIVIDKNGKGWETHTTADGREVIAMREGDIVAVCE